MFAISHQYKFKFGFMMLCNVGTSKKYLSMHIEVQFRYDRLDACCLWLFDAYLALSMHIFLMIG